MKIKILICLLSLSFTLVFLSCSASLKNEKELLDLRNTFSNIIPKPVSIAPTNKFFILDKSAKIYVEPMNTETSFIGKYLAGIIKPSTGYSLQVLKSDENAVERNIYLTINGKDKSLGEEGYELTVSEERINLSANKPVGLFRGVQTLRQLFSPSIGSSDIQSEHWEIPTGTIKDCPRFEWRGVMLDVARHFLSVKDVKSYIDLAALYKINYFHLHLSDDQGWRIQINSWPNLAIFGGSRQVDGGKGDYYTQAEYSEIVAYAQERYITVVPEIDMPGHTNAALASYPELNSDGIAPSLYTGIEVGFSALAISKDITYKFIDDVIKELSAITPGPYIHIGGDEAPKIDSIDYVHFIDTVQSIVYSFG